MAQAFAIMEGRDKVEAYSAGSKPSGLINPKAISAMAELNYDLSTHASKSLDEFNEMEFDAVITMGCGDACPFIPAKIREDWAIPDPRDMSKTKFKVVRDLIGQKVKILLNSILE